LLLRSNNDTARVIILCFSVIIAGIVALSLSNHLSVKGSLLFLLLIAGINLDSYVRIIPPVLLYFAALVVLGGSRVGWSNTVSRTSADELLFLGTLALVFVTINIMLKRRMRERKRQTERIERLEKAVEELSAANIGYNTFIQLAQHQAATEERNRIIREIHDGIGYTLTSIIMLSEVACDQVPRDWERIAQSLNSIRFQAKNGLADTRRSLRLLRSAEQGLPRGMAALQKMITVYQYATGVKVRLEVNSRTAVIEDPNHFLTVYRFVQEGLTNAFRHGEATEVTVRFQQNGSWLHVAVVDDGKGSQMIKEGLGLQGMRERVESLGGSISYTSAIGLAVHADIPVKENG
jgi:signal transduction histidine kinase